MVKNDSSGRSTSCTGYTPGQGDRPGSQPELGSRDTDFRPAYLDSITIQEGFADPTSASQKILDGNSTGERRLPALEDHRPAGRDGLRSTRQDQMVAVAFGRQPLHRAEHVGAAVRRQSTAQASPQGGDRQLRSDGAAEHPRRRAVRPGGDALHPAADPRIRGGGRRSEGARKPRLPPEPERRSRSWPSST